MSWFKFSLILALSSSAALAEKFNSKQCLDASFNTEIKHEGKFFGLIKNNLKIQKDKCIIDIHFKNVLETKWLIDICREPIHIKVNAMGNQNVYKRTGTCDSGKKSDYCTYWSDLQETLQDYGLIFADGERESLSTSHGQTFCTYQLLKKHLGEGVLFSKYDQPVNIFDDNVTNPVIPQMKPMGTTSNSFESVKDSTDTITQLNSASVDSPSTEIPTISVGSPESAAQTSPNSDSEPKF